MAAGSYSEPQTPKPRRQQSGYSGAGVLITQTRSHISSSEPSPETPDPRVPQPQEQASPGPRAASQEGLSQWAQALLPQASSAPNKLLSASEGSGSSHRGLPSLPTGPAPDLLGPLGCFAGSRACSTGMGTERATENHSQEPWSQRQGHMLGGWQDGLDLSGVGAFLGSQATQTCSGRTTTLDKTHWPASSQRHPLPM